MPKILRGIYEKPHLRSTITPMFLSNPGLGKTSILNKFAKEVGANVFEFITSQRNPFEISGMPIPDHSSKRMTVFDYDMLESMKDGDILFFDELTNGNPNTLNACLTLIESRKTISGKKLPDIMIVAAGNPQGSAFMTPQIKQRFVWYNTSYEKDFWRKYLVKKYKVTEEIFENLHKLVKSESFDSSTNNYITPRSVEKDINLCIENIPCSSDSVAAVLNTNIVFHKEFTITNSKGDLLFIGKDEAISWLKLKQFQNGADN